jgi:hypothetical protein
MSFISCGGIAVSRRKFVRKSSTDRSRRESEYPFKPRENEASIVIHPFPSLRLVGMGIRFGIGCWEKLGKATESMNARRKARKLYSLTKK